MIKNKVLVTGGAGFIGSFIVDELIKEGHDVTVFDNLDPQVHPNGQIPSYLNPNAKFIKGDVRDKGALKAALQDKEVVFHEAAAVSVGQSMYEIEKFMDINSRGTAQLLDLIVNGNFDVKKMIVASSMSTYGEGRYVCENCGEVRIHLRGVEQMQKNDWEAHCPVCNKTVKSIPTDEEKCQEINSVYALSKKDQEDLFISVGKAYGLPTVALRYFNVYGPRQSLSNPYTGVAAIFLSMIKNNRSPLVFEDGKQSRDFISVHDIAKANVLAMDSKSADHEIFNVGYGKKVGIGEIAEVLIELNKSSLKPNITGNFRKGDVRHCYADISKIKSRIGFEPKISFEDGMKELIEWSKSQESIDRVDQATQELVKRGLLETEKKRHLNS